MNDSDFSEAVSEIRSIIFQKREPDRLKYMDKETQRELEDLVFKLLAPFKIMFASDESEASLGSQLEEVNIEDTEKNRAQFRGILYATDDIEKYVSGISLSRDYVDLSDESGYLFRDYLKQIGIILGIRMDSGISTDFGPYNEYSTLGSHTLMARCKNYKAMGMKYGTWTTIVSIDKNKPSDLAIKNNSMDAAYFAFVCQCCGILPVVQAEVMSTGSHDVEVCQKTLERFLHSLVWFFDVYEVCLEAIILTISFVCKGEQSKLDWNEKEMARATIDILYRTVPAAIPAIGFTSGGLPEDLIASTMQIMYWKIGKKPWFFTFNCTRTLQHAAMKIWSQDLDDMEGPQITFAKTLRKLCHATAGTFLKKADVRFEKPQAICKYEYYIANEDEDESEELSNEEELEDFDESSLTKEEIYAKNIEKAEREKVLNERISKGVSRALKKFEKIKAYGWKQSMQRRKKK